VCFWYWRINSELVLSHSRASAGGKLRGSAPPIWLLLRSLCMPVAIESQDDQRKEKMNYQSTTLVEIWMLTVLWWQWNLQVSGSASLPGLHLGGLCQPGRHTWHISELHAKESRLLKSRAAVPMEMDRAGMQPYIAVTLGPSHCTPCHASLQGSPPDPVQPSRSGEPSAAYRSLMASTACITKPKKNDRT